MTARFRAALPSQVVRSGRFRLPGWTLGVSVFGDLDLDLRDATGNAGRHPRSTTSDSRSIAERRASGEATVG